MNTVLIWLGLKNASGVGKLGGILVTLSLPMALISGMVFYFNISNRNWGLDIDPAIWGQFGDFLGGTWGTLLFVGSSLLIIESIKKQTEHEQIRSFEAQFLTF